MTSCSFELTSREPTMKAGYAALLGVVIGYSACQGISASSAGSVQDAGKSSRGTGQTSEPRPSSNASSVVEARPTIAPGMCRLAVTGRSAPPCGSCQAICPACELRGVIADYLRTDSDSDEAYLAGHWNVPKGQKSHVSFVFASLPDPVHTHKAMLFDQAIDAWDISSPGCGAMSSHRVHSRRPSDFLRHRREIVTYGKSRMR